MLLAGMFALSACSAVPATAVPAPVTASTLTVVGSELVTSTPLVEPEGTQTTLPAAAVQISLPSPTPVRTQMSLSDGMVMLYVPAGDFLMGSLDGEGEKDEHPQHTVHLDDFWIDETEVTNRMYRECVDAGSCKEPARKNSYTREEYYDTPRFLDYPVIYVDWFQASRYCQWVGKRLPTEAEWEKAARSVDGRVYPWGNAEPGAEHANFYWLVGDTDRVGSYPAGASPYGALDMAGNVSEWVADWYGEYTTSPYRTYNPQGPDSGPHRIARGGSYLFSAFLIRSAERYWVSPYYADDDMGFRCAFSED